MHKKLLKFAAPIALLMTSSAVLAMPFDSFDPRSMAMGTTGVAVGDPSLAPFFNPAMLTASDPSKKYSIEFPIIGGRLYDPSNMHTNLQTLSDNVNALNASVTTANANASSTNSATIKLLPGNMNTVATNLDAVNNSLKSMSNQPLQGEFGAATVVGVPGKNWGFAFYADAWAAMGGTLEYNDATTLSNLSTSVKSAANILNGASSTASTACSAVQAGTGTTTDVTNCLAAANNLNSSLGTASNAVNFNTNTTLQSKIHIRGLLVEETGLSVSHSLSTSDHSWSLGFTPKVMNLTLFDALLSANNGSSTSNVTSNDYTAKYSTVNFDMGVAKSYNNGWRTGVVVKNVIPQSFNYMSIGSNPAGSAQSVTGTLNMNPQARLGVSHENAWSTVALDADMTRNDPAGLENASQFVGLGGELSAWGWAQLRAGYRADLLNPGQELISVGLGLSPRIPYFKPHLDLAVSVSKDAFTNGLNNATQAGVALKAGFNF